MSRPFPLWRIGIVGLAVLVAFGGLGARLAFLHFGENANLKARVQSIREKEEKILVGRGRILDTRGTVMAVDRAARHVIANPDRVIASGHMTFIGRQLARILDLDPAAVMNRLDRPGRQYERIKRFVPEHVARRIARMRLPGIYFEPCMARRYPSGSLMAHVLGFANWEGMGSAGVEQHMDSFLKGQPGLQVKRVDGRRQSLYDLRTVEIPPQAGADIYLTLDRNLQQILEQSLDRAVAEHSPEAACAILQRVRTGEILAMAARPDYDPNQFRTSDESLWRNPGIGIVYEPGSTFKVVTIASAIDRGVVTPDTVFDCENGVWYYEGKPLRDYHGSDALSVQDILKKSSNIGVAKIALRLGERGLEEAVRRFGFGSPTGIELPGEERGIVHPRRRWSAISITRIPMGHEISVTPLQMLNAVNAIANDGFLMRPRVIKRVTDTDGHVLREFEPEVLDRPIRPETSVTMRRLMARVTQPGGTGRRAAIDGYQVAGKTGTAQKPNEAGGYSDTENMASFVGFAPAMRPELAMIVVLDNPQPRRTGGRTAAPVFREVMAQALRYLDVPPSTALASAGGGGG